MPSASSPERTCIGCGRKGPKGSFARLVLKEGQAVVDLSQAAPGRGAYLCGSGCLAAAVKRKALQRAFKGKAQRVEPVELEATLRAFQGPGKRE